MTTVDMQSMRFAGYHPTRRARQPLNALGTTLAWNGWKPPKGSIYWQYGHQGTVVIDGDGGSFAENSGSREEGPKEMARSNPSTLVREARLREH